MVCTVSAAARLSTAARVVSVWLVSGASLLLSQPFPPTIHLGELAPADGFALLGVDNDDEAGFSVSGVGDVNRDGFADFAIAAPYASPSGTASGSIFVVFGSSALVDDPIELNALDGANGFRVDGAKSHDLAGRSVGGAGDMNGDGFADFALGAPGGDRDHLDSGYAYVIYGRESFPAILRVSELGGVEGFRITGRDQNGASGTSVAGAGDFNGDGYDDLAIGAPLADNDGEVYVVFGAPSFPGDFALNDLDGTNGFRLEAASRLGDLGWSVGAAGDVNGDGFSDVVAGAFEADGVNTFSGKAYLVFGKSGSMPAVVSVDSLDGSNGLGFEGENVFDNVGYSVSSAGDVNGDGLDEVAIGALGVDTNGSFSGTTYVVYGRTTFPASVELAQLDGENGVALRGVHLNDQAGVSVAGATDFNDDGYDDVFVGAAFADPNGTSSGETYVVFGGPSWPGIIELASLDGTNGLVIEGPSASDQSGFSIGAAGDVNGDGVGDAILGARAGHGGTGMAHVVFGRSPARLQLTSAMETCPGTARLKVRGLSPRSRLSLWLGTMPGQTVVSQGLCSGSLVQLDQAIRISTGLEAARDGTWQMDFDLDASYCGRSLQLVELSTCQQSQLITLAKD